MKLYNNLKEKNEYFISSYYYEWAEIRLVFFCFIILRSFIRCISFSYWKM